MSGTIADWERDRFAAETTAEIDSLDTAEPARTIVAVQDDRPELIALAGRITAGLSVQLLITPGGEDRRAFISLALDGQHETYEVAPEHAMDAFRHPFCYGGTLL
jgi:hypothetical protein